MKYRSLPPEAHLTVDLDPFVALYDRRSGQTHLLAEPAPQLLALLADEPLTFADLRTRLGAAFDLPDLTDEALAARLAELVDTGLIETR